MPARHYVADASLYDRSYTFWLPGHIYAATMVRRAPRPPPAAPRLVSSHVAARLAAAALLALVLLLFLLSSMALVRLQAHVSHQHLSRLSHQGWEDRPSGRMAARLENSGQQPRPRQGQTLRPAADAAGGKDGVPGGGAHHLTYPVLWAAPFWSSSGEGNRGLLVCVCTACRLHVRVHMCVCVCGLCLSLC